MLGTAFYYRYFCNTGADPLEKSQMAFIYWADDGPRLVLYGSSVLPSSTKKHKKNVVKVAPLWQNFLVPHMPVLPYTQLTL